MVMLLSEPNESMGLSAKENAVHYIQNVLTQEQRDELIEKFIRTHIQLDVNYARALGWAFSDRLKEAPNASSRSICKRIVLGMSMQEAIDDCNALQGVDQETEIGRLVAEENAMLRLLGMNVGEREAGEVDALREGSPEGAREGLRVCRLRESSAWKRLKRMLEE